MFRTGHVRKEWTFCGKFCYSLFPRTQKGDSLLFSLSLSFCCFLFSEYLHVTLRGEHLVLEGLQWHPFCRDFLLKRRTKKSTFLPKWTARERERERERWFIKFVKTFIAEPLTCHPDNVSRFSLQSWQFRKSGWSANIWTIKRYHFKGQSSWLWHAQIKVKSL